MLKIVIDCGHGGSDTGAIGTRSIEKDIVLEYGKYIKNIFSDYQVEIIMTRDIDQYLTLKQRCDIANNCNADYFISLHCNAFSDPAANGFETFVYTNVDIKTENFRKAIHDGIQTVSDLKDRGKKNSNFQVLRDTKMPAIIIEFGFITNESDENFILNNTWKDNICKSAVDSLVKHLNIKAKPQSSKSYMAIKRDDIEKIEYINIQGGITARQVMRQYKPDYLINLALYDTATMQNITYLETNNVKSGYLFSYEGIGIKDNQPIFCHKDDAFMNDDIRHYVSGSPLLVRDSTQSIEWGNKYSAYVDGIHERSGVGFDETNLYLAYSDGAVSLSDFADDCITKFSPQYMINCDGGGSCHLQSSDTTIVKSNRSNVSWLLVYLKKQDYDNPVDIIYNDKKIVGKIEDGTTWAPVRQLSEELFDKQVDFIDGKVYISDK